MSQHAFFHGFSIHQNAKRCENSQRYTQQKKFNLTQFNFLNNYALELRRPMFRHKKKEKKDTHANLHKQVPVNGCKQGIVHAQKIKLTPST